LYAEVPVLEDTGGGHTCSGVGGRSAGIEPS